EVPAPSEPRGVRLVIPSSPDYLRLAGAAVVAMARTVSGAAETIAGLQVAIDELCFVLAGPQGRPGTLEVRCHADATRVVVEGEATFAGGPPITALSSLSRDILERVVDEHSVMPTQ